MLTNNSSKRWLNWLIEGLLLAALLIGIHFWQTRNLADGPAPPLPDEGWERLHWPADPIGDRPLLVHFWASWCPLCRLEQGSIQSLAQDHAVITIASHSGDLAEVRDYMAKEGIRFPAIIDETGELAAQWGVRGYPASFVIDRAGRIRFKTQGLGTGWGLRLRLWLAD